ncbi:MAG: PBP1A family penicillin-binding protein [Liquorilactobacillus nagelii]|jgi:penicillin-binding protein 2A|uniref:PBP1A family penicillin-binding protein n=1 Tax=Liquorilactobacillus nagelii TaxID=82688 RepID=UPI00242EE4E7|nr:PBP1A family penicillin-binding protein [Liquorilactobacillus nagelii]MCI1920285.1 PBP1A family penicillin-binding protein [Liquorilactobacillus nagelii]MCI1975929.1 PBP1A family penicillin-binding protein [Liquorilactobacillus nagelii]
MKEDSIAKKSWQAVKHWLHPIWLWLRKQWKRFCVGRIILIGLLSLFLIASCYLIYIAKTAKVGNLKAELEQSTEIYDYQGKKAGYLYSQKGTWKNLNQISPNMQNAVLSTEDRNFYHEYGFSFKGIARAGLLYLRNKLLGKNYISGGGSTLTQQLVKNAFLSQEQTFSRKAKEIFIAMQVENEYSKKEILTMYLNNAYFGNGVWGVEDASLKYFGVHASQLSVPQAATLAGMLTDPGGYNPIDHPQASKQRRNVVLQLMVENQKLTAAEAKNYQQTAMTTDDQYQYQSGYKYPYYFDAVISEAIKKYGLSETEIMNGGYKIYTSLNQNYQKELQADFADNQLFPYNATDGTKAQGASVAVNPKNGGVAALVGGRSGSHVFRGYNRATQLIRSPGSAIKPIAVYAAALSAGYHYDSYLQDKLRSYGTNKYTPHNYDNQYAGKIMMYKALAESKNAATVWLLNKIGVQRGYNLAKKFGLNVTSSDDNLSLALGGMKKGESPYQMASAYAAFAANGELHSPYLITKIVDASGKVIVNNPQTSSKRVLSKKNAQEMTSMMMDVYNDGTGINAKPSGYTIAGKTGTTQYTSGSTADSDHWYIGYTPDVVVATWVGFDSNKYSLIDEGTRGGSALFKTEMEGILPNTAGTSFKIKSAGSRVAATESDSSDNLWSGVANAGKKIKDNVSQSANQAQQKAAELFSEGKQKLESIFGR